MRFAMNERPLIDASGAFAERRAVSGERVGHEEGRDDAIEWAGGDGPYGAPMLRIRPGMVGAKVGTGA
jgi:hypothetical protein